MQFVLHPGELKYADFQLLIQDKTQLELDKTAQKSIHASAQLIQTVIHENKKVYGVNTGFGALAHTFIHHDDLAMLQKSLVLSHAAGTGDLLCDDAVRLILALKINSLARGFSGVRIETIEALIKLYNANIYPCIPSKGSVGASGDLAPLAHLSSVLIGEGFARHHGKIISAKDALQIAGLKPLALAPKEGLALLNGTQVSTALAILGLLQTETLFISALIAGAMSVDAARASDVPFDARIQILRGSKTQIKTAEILRELLKNSGIRHSHFSCEKIQDPYSLRCQPQVMGACLQQFLYAKDTLLTEANAVSDNPLVFADDQAILSGGNFHAEPVAFAADSLALAIAEIGSLSERRTALLIDPAFSHLPAFLVENAGLNSGFMLAQVTAAALVSENKSLAHPASVDSIPTSNNQEDHVSMATYAARRLLQMTDNANVIVAIELLAACQSLDFLRPLQSSELLENVHRFVREHISFYEKDRYFAPDIAAAKQLVSERKIRDAVGIHLF